MRTPEEGIIDIQGLPAGEYELLITAPECGVTKERVVLRDDALEKEVVLKPAYTASVRVLTEKKKSPVEWAEVYASISAGRPGAPGGSAPRSRRYRRSARCTTDRQNPARSPSAVRRPPNS